MEILSELPPPPLFLLHDNDQFKLECHIRKDSSWKKWIEECEQNEFSNQLFKIVLDNICNRIDLDSLDSKSMCETALEYLNHQFDESKYENNPSFQEETAEIEEIAETAEIADTAETVKIDQFDETAKQIEDAKKEASAATATVLAESSKPNVLIVHRESDESDDLLRRAIQTTKVNQTSIFDLDIKQYESLDTLKRYLNPEVLFKVLIEPNKGKTKEEIIDDAFKIPGNFVDNDYTIPQQGGTGLLRSKFGALYHYDYNKKLKEIEYMLNLINENDSDNIYDIARKYNDDDILAPHEPSDLLIDIEKYKKKLLLDTNIFY